MSAFVLQSVSSTASAWRHPEWSNWSTRSRRNSIYPFRRKTPSMWSSGPKVSRSACKMFEPEIDYNFSWCFFNIKTSMKYAWIWQWTFAWAAWNVMMNQNVLSTLVKISFCHCKRQLTYRHKNRKQKALISS